MGAVAELAAAASSLPPGFPACTTTLSVVRRSPCTIFPVTAAAVARRRRRCLLPHPPLLQPLPTEPRAGRGSGWPGRTTGRPPPSRPWLAEGPRRPAEPAPMASSAVIHVEDLARQFDESQGPSCNVIDSGE